MSEEAFDGIDLSQLYREHLLDHYKNPRNHGTLADAEHFHDLNPLCGDEIGMHIHVANDRIADISFTGRGCAIFAAMPRAATWWWVSPCSSAGPSTTWRATERPRRASHTDWAAIR